MITWLPFKSLEWSARCLDDTRLSHQRMDIYNIMYTLLIGEGRVDHRGVKMWRGHERALLAYQQVICNEWEHERGHEDGMWDKTRILFLDMVKNPVAKPLVMPAWFGDVDFHISHQAGLLRKDETHYRRWFPGISTNHQTIWPT